MSLNIVLLGAPGAGKGTIAQYLAKNYGMAQVSTGDALREEVKACSDLGKQVEPIMKAGKLVSDELIAEVLKSRLEKIPAERGVILDGYPRTLHQADLLDGILMDAGRKLDLVLDVEADDELIVRRLSARKQCKQCNAIYGIDVPPKVEGKCDKCGGEVYTRHDDMPDVVRKRLQTYRKKTMPLIKYYKKHGAVVEINGNNPLDQVFADVEKVMEKGE